MFNETIKIRHGHSRKSAAQRIRDVHGLPCTDATLANLASEGAGPVYKLVAGRAYYRDEDIDVWARSRISAPIRKASDARRRAIGEAA